MSDMEIALVREGSTDAGTTLGPAGLRNFFFPHQTKETARGHSSGVKTMKDAETHFTNQKLQHVLLEITSVYSRASYTPCCILPTVRPTWSPS